MSLSTAGVWAVGVWDQTVWADGVWREGAAAVVEVDTAGGGASRRARKYPRWVVINGQRFRVWNAEEERQLLQAMAERAEVAAKTAEALGDKPLAKEALRRKVRIEKRIATVDDREQEWLRRLMDEDEEILTILVS